MTNCLWTFFSCMCCAVIAAAHVNSNKDKLDEIKFCFFFLFNNEVLFAIKLGTIFAMSLINWVPESKSELPSVFKPYYNIGPKWLRCTMSMENPIKSWVSHKKLSILWVVQSTIAYLTEKHKFQSSTAIHFN